MIIEHSNEIVIKIPTGDPDAVLAIIYGLTWHRINNGLHHGKTKEDLKREYEIIRAIDKNDCKPDMSLIPEQNLIYN